MRASHCGNITPEGERRRRLGGATALAAGAIVGVALALRAAPPLTWAAVFPFAFGAAWGLLQARAKTCVILGFKGIEETPGGGFRRVQDEAIRAAARRQAGAVLWKTTAVAAVVTLLAMVVSGATVRTGAP